MYLYGGNSLEITQFILSKGCVGLSAFRLGIGDHFPNVTPPKGGSISAFTDEADACGYMNALRQSGCVANLVCMQNSRGLMDKSTPSGAFNPKLIDVSLYNLSTWLETGPNGNTAGCWEW